jgi:hypothetical protein
MDVDLHFSALNWPVEVETLRWVDSPSDESYKMTKAIHFPKLMSESEPAGRLFHGS